MDDYDALHSKRARPNAGLFCNGDVFHHSFELKSAVDPGCSKQKAQFNRLCLRMTKDGVRAKEKPMHRRSNWRAGSRCCLRSRNSVLHTAARDFALEVGAGTFPSPEHTF